MSAFDQVEINILDGSSGRAINAAITAQAAAIAAEQALSQINPLEAVLIGWQPDTWTPAPSVYPVNPQLLGSSGYIPTTNGLPSDVPTAVTGFDVFRLDVSTSPPSLVAFVNGAWVHLGAFT